MEYMPWEWVATAVAALAGAIGVMFAWFRTVANSWRDEASTRTEQVIELTQQLGDVNAEVAKVKGRQDGFEKGVEYVTGRVLDRITELDAAREAEQHKD